MGPLCCALMQNLRQNLVSFYDNYGAAKFPMLLPPFFLPADSSTSRLDTLLTNRFQWGNSYVSRSKDGLYVYILWGDMAQKLFSISEKGPLSGAARSHANSCALAACRLYNAYVRKLFCVHLRRSVACNCCRASRPRTLEYTIVYGQALKRT